MALPSKASLQALKQRLEIAQEALEKAAPQEFAEYDLCRRLVEQRESLGSPDAGPYLNRQDALQMILTEHGKWLSKSELFDEMEKIGLVAGKAQRGAVNALIDFHVSKGSLQQSGEGNSTEVMIGLPGWASPEEEDF